MILSKSELVKKYAHDDEEKLVLARLLDKLEECEQKNCMTNTRFLNEQQCKSAKKMLENIDNARHLFWGGYEGAERNILIFFPEYLDADQVIADEEDAPLTAIRATFPLESILSHRDILGSLMGLGIKRETVGDILVSNGIVDIVVLKDIKPFLLQNFQSAGRVKLQTEVISAEMLYIPDQKYILIRDTVASLRFDNVVAAGFGISRTKAAESIESGRAALNTFESTKADKIVAEGDVIAVRGHGKIALYEVGGPTKKGRIGIVIKKYV